MIRVSNLRKEQLAQSGETRIVCDIDCGFSQSRQLWFSVPEQYGDWLTDDVDWITGQTHDKMVMVCQQ